MKKPGRIRAIGRGLRRGTAFLLALLGVWMAGAALVSQWASGTGPLLSLSQKPAASPEEASEEQDLEAVTPDKIQEKTISGGGTGYVNAQGVSLFNRTSKTVDLEAVAQGGSSLAFGKAEDGPQILIMHTHGTESYARDGTEPYTETGTARTTDTNYNMIRVGDEIARIFTEMGLNVVHDKTLYDYPAYNGAYDRSRAGIEAMLAQYPTIQMVLDVHRDDLVGSDGTIYKPVLQIDGVKTAQVMLVVGSDDAGAQFPDWPEHLALAMGLQQQMNALWPGLARPITLRTARFNQQLTKGSLLVEVGGHGNTLEEALAGARLFARVAGKTLLERVAR
ncbi:MAG: stage II sporulation protein P [Evtepia sp.]|uniref:stage II sporulation protein P n=1 Tax=Evtepia sp. TaxID=2773933 RepID=UPI002A751E7B|nr:stage II sporulation protein P [Evtepia sp.]MDY3015265.1 stage II sporulation protein P [Evtepia sp.]